MTRPRRTPDRYVAGQTTFPGAQPAPTAARTYCATQPHRCDGGEVGPAGHCLACGAAAGRACRMTHRGRR